MAYDYSKGYTHDTQHWVVYCLVRMTAMHYQDSPAPGEAESSCLEPMGWSSGQNKLGSVSGTWYDSEKDVLFFPVDGCDHLAGITIGW